MTSNFIDQFGFNEEEFGEQEEKSEWVGIPDFVISIHVDLFPIWLYLYQTTSFNIGWSWRYLQTAK